MFHEGMKGNGRMASLFLSLGAGWISAIGSRLCLYITKETTPLLLELEGGWGPRDNWTLWWREMLFDLPRNRIMIPKLLWKYVFVFIVRTQTVNNQEEVIWRGINEINLHWYWHNCRKYSSWNKSCVINSGFSLSFKLKC
jgi:hypothetical protein